MRSNVARVPPTITLSLPASSVATLPAEGRKLAAQPFSPELRKAWSYRAGSTFRRQGLRLGAMDDPARHRAQALIGCALSSRGYLKTTSIMALDAVGDRTRAVRLLADMQHLRADGGGYWTGYVFPEDVNWPAEQTTYTAAAVILAVDALGRTTPGSGIMRGETLTPHFGELALECGCPSVDVPADRVAGRASRPA